MRRTRRSVLGGVAIAASLVLAACGSSDDNTPAAETPVTGGTMVDLYAFGPGASDHLDPALAAGVEVYQVDDALFDGLTATDDKGQVQPAVAEKYTSSSDAKVWTFTLRENVKFHDGTPVLASSFKRAWERVLNPALASDNAYRFDTIVSTPGATTLDNVVADDNARTLTVTLPRPDSDLPYLTALIPFSPVPASAPLDATWEKSAMVGNGPFKMDAAWDPPKGVNVTRYDGYYGGYRQKPAYLDHIQFKTSNSLEAAYNDFAAGNGQIAYFPSTATADLQKYQKENIVNSPTMGVEFWGFNMKDPTVGGPENLKLRQAIDLAVNKKEVNDKAYGGAHQIATQFSSPTTPGSDSKPGDGQPNIEQAKKLLQEWGKTPPAIKVSFNKGANHDVKAQVIVDSLNAVGIPASLDGQDLDTYRPALQGGKVQFFRFAWVADYASYRTMIEPPFSSATVGDTNFPQYSNPAVDKLFADAQTETTASKANSIYNKAEKLIMADQPVVPLNWTTANLIKSPQLRGFQVDPLGEYDSTQLWLAP